MDNNYRVFSRACRNWEQFATATKRTIKRNITLQECREICDEFNNNRTYQQISKGVKYEFEQE